MRFCDVLQKLMEQYDLRSMDFCQRLGLKKSYFSKVKNGTTGLPDFQLVEQMADLMTLNPRDRRLLFESYRRERFGESLYRIEKAMERLYRAEAVQTAPEELEESGIQLKNGMFFSNQREVVHALRKVVHAEWTKFGGGVLYLEEYGWLCSRTIRCCAGRLQNALRRRRIRSRYDGCSI